MDTQSAQQEIQEIRTLLKEVILLQRQIDLKFKETDKKIKDAFDLFTGQRGRLIESLVEIDIVNYLLQKRGLSVQNTSTRRKGNQNNENFEIDIKGHNVDFLVIGEVKTTLRVKHVPKIF